MTAHPGFDTPWFDAHCHFDFDALDQTREGDWALAQSLGVTGLMIPGITRAQTEGALQKGYGVSARYHLLFGLHPYWCNLHQPEDLGWLDDMLRRHRPVALGEAGTDRILAKQSDIDLETQWRWLMAQIELAEAHKLPLVLHIRGTHDEVAAELRRRRFSYGGMVHAFSGSLQQGRHWHDLGFGLGVGGAMTHPRAHRLRQTLSGLPLEALLLETDAPDMKPAFLARDTNTPAMIPLYGAMLARLRNKMAMADLAEQLQQNLYRIFPALAVISSE